MEIRKKLSENSIDLTFTYDIIGIIYSYKSQYDKAFEYLFKSLEIRKKLSENSIDVANSYSSIGYVYIDKSQYNEALEYSLKSLQIALKLFDEISVNVAMLYNNVGFIYETPMTNKFDTQRNDYLANNVNLKKNCYEKKADE